MVINMLQEPGIILSDNLRLNKKTSKEGILVIGPTGVGKTSVLFMPNLLDYKLRGTIVVSDPKGELYEKTSEYQRTVCNRKVILFDPMKPDLSDKYNFLEHCKDDIEIDQLSQTIIYAGALSAELSTGVKSNDSTWKDMAIPLLTAALIYVHHLGRPYNTIEMALKMLTERKDSELDILFSSKDVPPTAYKNYKIYKATGTADKTAGGIKSTLANALKIFTYPNINKVSSYSTFSFNDLRNEEYIVYISYPERMSIQLSPFFSCFYTQLINKLIDIYDNSNGQCIPVHFMCDEFANIGFINGFNVTCTTCRSRDVSLMICLQDLAQLMNIYGKYNAETILNNLKTKVVLPAISDKNALNYVSELIGTQEIRNMGETMSSDNKCGANNTSYNYSFTTKPLMTPDELRRLDSDTMIVLIGNKSPIKAPMKGYYKSKKYLSRVTLVKDTMKRPKLSRYDNEKIIKDFDELLDKTVVAAKERSHRNAKKADIIYDNVYDISRAQRFGDYING